MNIVVLDILLSYPFWVGTSLSFFGGMCLGFKLAYGGGR